MLVNYKNNYQTNWKKHVKLCQGKKKALEREQTPTSSNFSMPLSNEEKAALVYINGNIVKEELQAQEAVLQEMYALT